MDSYPDERPVKRFKYQSYKDSLKEVHLPSALVQTKFDNEISDNDSHFCEALNYWKELNLAPVFIKFSNEAEKLSASMPMLLHNWEAIVELWLEALQAADDEGLKALLDLFQNLAHDLRTTLAPSYPSVLKSLLRLLPRSLSAPAITALLTTFSALFKYVLVPAVDAELLQQAWSLFRDVLPRCDPEVQRATAEVWGTTLRRLKKDARVQCVGLVAASATHERSIADACAWVFVSACKSVTQTLHTATASITRPLMSFYLSCSVDDDADTFMLVRRVLTALIHHCKGPEQFGPVADGIVEQFVECAKACEDDNETEDAQERVRRALEVCTVISSVRQGSRLTQRHLNILLAQLPSIPLTSTLHLSLLKLSAATLTATSGDLGLWMGAGKRILDRSWERPGLALELCGVLVDLSWGGFKAIALPQVLKRTPDLLQSDERRTLELLVSLHYEKRLSGADVVWKQRFQAWVEGRLTSWERTKENVLALHNVLALSSLLPSSTVTSIVIRIINATIDHADPRDEYESTPENSAWVLGACLECLASRPSAEWADQIDLRQWADKVFAKWAWSSTVLGGLVSLVNASSRSSELKYSVKSVQQSTQSFLLSHSRSLRLATLRLLTTRLVESPQSAAEVFKRLLQAEEVSVDVQGSRERVLRISRLPVVIKDGDEIAADICCRWLIAQLKVNLRPLWAPSAEALSALARRFGDLVWRLLFEQLQRATSEISAEVAEANGTNDEPKEEDDDIREEERSWRDPSAHKLRVVNSRWHSGRKTMRALVQDQSLGDRYDAVTFESQLLLTFGECSSLAEKYSRDLVPHFLSLGQGSPSKLPRHKLSSWLTLFSKFVNPKALRSTETLHELYTSLLSHPDRTLQRLALSCILTYKSPHLSPYEDTLRSLLDDTRWRDSLTNLDIAEIEATDRRELVDTVTRLLFGLMLERKGRSRGADRRAAVLSTLGGCTDDELTLLVALMLRSLSKNIAESAELVSFAVRPLPTDISETQQIGFLTLLGDLLKHLGSRLIARWPVLLQVLLDILANAQHRIDARHIDDALEEGNDTEDELDESNELEGSSRNFRTIRQLGLKRFADFFRCPVSYDFSLYMPTAFIAFISPRLASLDKENTQAPSALLELFYVWTLRIEHARYLVDYDDRTLSKVYDCLIATNVKPAVISKVFDIVDRILSLSEEDETLQAALLKPHVPLLLTNLSLLVERTKGVTSVSDTLGRRQISILSKIASYLTDSKQASVLLSLFFPLLKKPSKMISEPVKADLITILRSLFPLIPELSDPRSQIYDKTYSLLAQLLQTLRSRQARQSLLAAFRCLATVETSITALADLMASLNAYSAKRIDEPNFDQRLAAFSQLNEELWQSLSSKHWLPILYNMLNFIQDPEELTVRSNASLAMRRFIDVVSQTEDPSFEQTFTKTLYPGLKNGLRSKNEMVRTEILGVISYAVSKCDRLAFLQEMKVLLANGDDEANFFNNVHHIQLHRRTRALRRLAEFCDEGHLRSTTLAEIFVPLVGNFIAASGSVDHLLVNEAIAVTGRMARQLQWGSYYALTQQYLKLSGRKDTLERVYIRALVSILDNFHLPMDEVVVDVEDEGAEDDYEGVEGPPAATTQVTKAAETSRITDAVNMRLLPRLLQHLENRDETEDSLRIPIALGIVQVAKHLPEQTREPQIARLLTILSQVFRSKSQDTRDLARETMCRIAIVLGPGYLPLMLRELRAALLRGPHLHVLAYVTHALLVHVTSSDHATLFTNLDGCINDVAHVSAEVIFGESGKDVQSEDFKTKMREVRSSSAKGIDSFTIIAKFITPSKISNLLLPIRNILKETEALKVLQQADDLLRRIAGGLNANQHLVPAELLVLCHTLISQNARFLKSAPQPRKKAGKEHRDVIVQTKRKLEVEANHYANNSYRFVSFGLDLFITAHRRSRLDFQDAQIIARLEPMMAVIGNTLYSDRVQVVIPGLKAASAILKCPLKSVDKSLPVFIHQIMDIIKQAGSTEAEVVQTAFKSLASIVRDHPNAQVKEKDLVFLLELLSPDLEEPSRQVSVFTMLRAIVARKFVVPEIYDMMNKVTEVMVTSQSPQVQEMCRGVLLQFLLDYPQGKGRLRNQMTLLAKNLSYVHESGRKSVMELLGAIIVKFEANLVREYADLLFIALVMVIANDDSAKCREMASELIKSLFSRLADAQRNVVLSHIHSWAIQYAQPQLARVSLQVYGIIINLLQTDVSPYANSMLEDLNNSLSYSAQLLEEATAEADGEELGVDSIEWQISYHALVVQAKLLRVLPELTTQPGKVQWPAVVQHLVFPHTWTRTASCRLLGLLFAATPAAAPRADLPDESPFSRAGMEDVAKKLCLQLQSLYLDAALSLQVVKNLFYIGKCFSAIELPAETKDVDADAEEDERNDVEEPEDHQEEAGARKHPLAWMFSKLSYQARRAHNARRNKSSSPTNWVHQPSSVLKWFAAMVSYMEPSQTERFLMHILSPVYRIAEDDTIHDPQMAELKTLSVELQDLVQTKVGTTKFANVYNRIKQNVVGIRRERRNARVIQTTTNPEAAAKRKLQRNALKKDSRKRKNQTFADGKGRAKRIRDA